MTDDSIPYFCWDRKLTVSEIRSQLRSASNQEWLRLASWILREASTVDVWEFLTPNEVRNHLDELMPLLGRRRAFWRYILGVWHELGRI